MHRIIIVLLISLCVNSYAQRKNNTMNENPKTELEAIAKKHNVIGLGVCIIKDGKSSTFYYGLRNLTDSLPVTENTLFRVASISKVVTAIAIMQLIEQGIIQLDEDINNYLKRGLRNRYYPKVPITCRMLLSHTSSINDNTDYEQFIERTYKEIQVPAIYELFNNQSNIWMNEKPGKYFNYSSLNYGILATIIENVTGERFDRYVETNILQQLGISGGFNIANIEDKHQISVLYRGTIPQTDYFQNNYPIDKDFPIGINGLYYAPQGGLRISVKNLSKILQMLLNKGIYKNNTILKAKTVEEMEISQWENNGTNGDTYHNLFLNWGLGLQKTTQTKGGDFIMPNTSFTGHIGDAYGLIGCMYYNREKNIGFVFISNGTTNKKGYLPGINSSYPRLEEEVFDFIYRNFIKE